MNRITHPKLKELHLREIQWRRDFCKRHREQLAKLELIINEIEVSAPSWFFSSPKLYVPVNGRDKAAFASTVRAIAALVNEAPNISVLDSQYCADFETANIHVYVMGASDCKLIEVEEVRTVRKPHPECLAALKPLEDIA